MNRQWDGHHQFQYNMEAATDYGKVKMNKKKLK